MRGGGRRVKGREMIVNPEGWNYMKKLNICPPVCRLMYRFMYNISEGIMSSETIYFNFLLSIVYICIPT